jgi:DNA-binding PadR family transcriptional regulator
MPYVRPQPIDGDRSSRTVTRDPGLRFVPTVSIASRQMACGRLTVFHYPELARLAAQGLILQTSTGPRGAKRFEATEEGIAELRRWITDVEPARGIRNETLLRVFFAHLVDPTNVEAFLRREADEYRRHLAVLERIAAESPPKTPSERASSLTLNAGIRANKARIEWAEAAIEEVRTW